MTIREIKSGIYPVGAIDWGGRMVYYFQALDRLAEEILNRHRECNIPER